MSRLLDTRTLSVQQLAKKWNLSIEQVKKLIDTGAKEEREHTSNKKAEKEIARDHLKQDPNYYKKLKKVEKIKESKMKTLRQIISEAVARSKKPPTEAKTGRGRGRLVKALGKLRGKAWQQSYDPRHATAQTKEPDMFWQGPPEPTQTGEVSKAISSRNRTLGKIDRIVTALNTKYPKENGARNAYSDAVKRNTFNSTKFRTRGDSRSNS